MPNYTSAENLKLTTFLGRTKMASGEIDPRPHKYWLSVKPLKEYGQGDNTICRLYQWLWIHSLAKCLPKESIGDIMILYRNTEMKVRCPGGDTEYFDILAGVLQGDTLAPYLFIVSVEHRMVKWKKTVSSWQRKEAEGTAQEQLPTPTTPMTQRFWQMHPPKPKPYCIVGNEPPQASTSMSIYTKQNTCALIKHATFLH